MKDQDRDNLYRLFRDHGDVLGTSGTALVALESFIASVRQVRCSADQLKGLVNELTTTIKSTEPRITPLIHLIEEFEAEMRDGYTGDVKATKDRLIAVLQGKIDKQKEMLRRVVKHGRKCIADGDVVIVYSTSAAVRDILLEAHREGKKIRVLILKQDFTKTRKLIWSVTGADIDHQVIPEYNLSNFVASANKVFLGAISITPDQQAVCPLGTTEVVSLCHLRKIPVYLFADSLKFSHRPSSEHCIHAKLQDLRQDDVSYSMTIHSHCLLNLDMIDYLVTEDGEVDKSAIERYRCHPSAI
jgi:translation initiation factor 2B subunit (eIF-2B alpha/beta/delta family)